MTGLSFSIFNFQLSIALALGLTLAACHEEPLPADPADNAIPFEMVFSAASRVATDADFRSTWEEGDAIGIFAVKHDPGTWGYLARDGSNYINNARLTRTGDKWVPDPGTELWWSDDGKVLDFYAYYPYSGTATDPGAIAFSASADQNGTTPTGQPAYNATDILAAKATGNGTRGHAKGSTVTLSFRHVLAMVQVTVDPGDPDRSPGAMENLSVTLLGCRPAGTLNLTSGKATTLLDDHANPVAPVTMYRPGTPGDDSYDAFTFRALVPPQTIAKNTRPYVVNSGGEPFPATVLTDPLELTGGNVTRFGNTLLKRGIRSAADLVAFSEAWNAVTIDELTGDGDEIPDFNQMIAAYSEVITTWSDEGTPNGTIRLHEDINMSGVTNFTPIGKDESCFFLGTFDGNGHTISNLTVNVTSEVAGLFGANLGTIRDLTLERCTVTSTVTNDAISAIAGGIAAVNLGTITGCTVNASTIKATATSNDTKVLAGGIAGNNGGTITGCTMTTSSVTATLTGNDYAKAGGIAGEASDVMENATGITGCTVKDVTINATDEAGGIIGSNYTSAISNCSVTDATITSGADAGGIAGYNNDAEITNCTVTGNVTVEAEYAGGIVGMNQKGAISGCSVTGAEITATETATTVEMCTGGIAGMTQAPIRNCTVTATTVIAITTNEDIESYAGGIAGTNEKNSQGTNPGITGCTVTGNTRVEASYEAGGIAGLNEASTRECSVTNVTVKATGENDPFAGGIAGGNYGTITGSHVADVTVTSEEAGGIAGSNEDGEIAGCSVTGNTSIEGIAYAGGIAGYNGYGDGIGCIAAPKSITTQGKKGVCAGSNEDGNLSACYAITISDINNVSSGNSSGCTSFSGNDVKETDNFFTTAAPPDKLPIELMNEALQTAGATVRWTAGNAASGWYPITIKN